MTNQIQAQQFTELIGAVAAMAIVIMGLKMVDKFISGHQSKQLGNPSLGGRSPTPERLNAPYPEYRYDMFDWVTSGWRGLNIFARRSGIEFFTPSEAYRSMLEGRMPINDIKLGPLDTAIRSVLSLYEKSLKEGPLPNWRVPHPESIERLRAFMAGYHLIAIGKAPDRVVDDTYSLIKDEFLKFVAAYEEPPEVGEFEETLGVGEWYHDLHLAATKFTNGARADKVLAIDAVVGLLHEYEARTLVDELFVSGLESFEFTPMWVTLNQLFDIWFGPGPRRGGVTFADWTKAHIE